MTAGPRHRLRRRWSRRWTTSPAPSGHRCTSRPMIGRLTTTCTSLMTLSAICLQVSLSS
uniref:Uncharacterized protein n=1 Tax=Arundo donax TaxID=35708 RepID=A0A0A8Y5Z4_ARUDO